MTRKFYYIIFHEDIKISNEQKMLIYEKIIKSLRKYTKTCGEGYCKRPETEHVDCRRVLFGDKNYTRTLTGKNRVFLNENPYLNMSCSAIRERIQPRPGELNPLKIGVAFARIVYKDYEFIEKQVQVSYHPQNVFCFAVDKDAPFNFTENIKKLADCMDNVIMLPVTEHYDSSGHNVNLAHFRCKRQLLKFPTWNYLMLLQNYDLITKSVYELSRIFEIFGGANDVQIESVYPERLNPQHRWDPKRLRLFRNESGIPRKVLFTPMTLSYGWVQASLSRKAVDWMVNTVDLTRVISQWNETEYGGDEQLTSTFNINAQLKMPGHFTDKCLKNNIATDYVSRMTQWDKRDNWSNCASKTSRNEICIIGIEDFQRVATMPNLMFNKVIPEFDWSIVECTAELLYNRTYSNQVDHQLDEYYYGNMVQVLYHKHHKEPNYRLNCTPSYKPWEYKIDVL